MFQVQTGIRLFHSRAYRDWCSAPLGEYARFWFRALAKMGEIKSLDGWCHNANNFECSIWVHNGLIGMGMQETAEEVGNWIQKMGKEYARIYGPFAVWMRRVEEKGALDTKTKELVSVALAVATQCRWCIAVHTNAALDAGATRDQVMEACFVACLFRGAPACMYSQLVMQTIDEHQKNLPERKNEE
jgi:AhpD family alkylhydroperoxidase